MLVSSRMRLSCAATGAAASMGGGWRACRGWEGTLLLTAACWFNDMLEAADQITLRIMASETMVL